MTHDGHIMIDRLIGMYARWAKKHTNLIGKRNLPSSWSFDKDLTWWWALSSQVDFSEMRAFKLEMRAFHFAKHKNSWFWLKFVSFFGIGDYVHFKWKAHILTWNAHISKDPYQLW